MNTFRTVLFALPLVVAAAITGCAAEPAGEDTADATGAASATSASSPITLQNYVQHPKIKAIRDQVAAIEAMQLTKTTKPGCDGSNDKFVDASGAIRKLVGIGGEGGWEFETSVYYNDQGKAIFVFEKAGDFTGEKTKNADNVFVTQTRRYFDAATGKVLFAAVREAEVASFDAAVTTADRLPQGDEALVKDDSIYADPNAWYEATGCPTNVEVEEPGQQ